MRTESTTEDCQTDMSEQGSAKKLCATAKGKFSPAINNLDLAMTSKAPVTTIESRYDGELYGKKFKAIMMHT